MTLLIITDTLAQRLEVADDLAYQATDFFAKMDHDMDQGWQMGAEWVEYPNPMQRCQIAADKLYTAQETANQPLAHLMAAYILRHFPQVTEIYINTNGEIQETRFV